MIPSGPLRRFTRLVSATPPRRSAPLARTTPLRKVSVKQASVLEEWAIFRDRQLAERSWCEAGPTLLLSWDMGDDTLARPVEACWHRSVDLHHLWPVGDGGPHVPSEGLLVAGTLAVCRSCHSWIHSHRPQATALGLLRSRPLDAADYLLDEIQRDLDRGRA